MNSTEKFVQALSNLPFNGKHSDVLGLYERLQDFQFYLEARGQNHLAEQMNACCWELKMRLPIDREEQWLWTFVWMKDKVLRRLGVQADASTSPSIHSGQRLSARAEIEVSALTPPSTLLKAQGTGLVEDLELPFYRIEMPAVLNPARV